MDNKVVFYLIFVSWSLMYLWRGSGVKKEAPGSSTCATCSAGVSWCRPTNHQGSSTRVSTWGWCTLTGWGPRQTRHRYVDYNSCTYALSLLSGFVFKLPVYLITCFVFRCYLCSGRCLERTLSLTPDQDNSTSLHSICRSVMLQTPFSFGLKDIIK